ncbi:MAG: PIN domain-containing protein [Methylococcales bacterium]
MLYTIEINIVLDTNIYRHNPSRNNLDFKAIEKLALAGKLTLHIPYIVEREFITQQQEYYSKDIEKVLSGITSLIKKELPDNTLSIFRSFMNELEDHVDDINSNAENLFINWVEHIGANRMPICLDQAKAAMDDYFEGNLPFKTVKKRDDIPDGFIVQAIKTINDKSSGRVYVVSNDIKVRESFEDSYITTFCNLSELIGSDIIQSRLRDLDLFPDIEINIEEFKRYEDDNGVITQSIRSTIGTKILWKEIEGKGSIGDDFYEKIISGYDEPENIILTMDELTYYGNGMFGVPFILNISVTGIFNIHKSEYYSMSRQDTSLLSVTDNNEFTLAAEKKFDVSVEGVVSVAINRDNYKSDISSCIDTDDIAIDYIDSIRLAG